MNYAQEILHALTVLDTAPKELLVLRAEDFASPEFAMEQLLLEHQQTPMVMVLDDTPVEKIGMCINHDLSAWIFGVTTEPLEREQIEIKLPVLHERCYTEQELTRSYRRKGRTKINAYNRLTNAKASVL